MLPYLADIIPTNISHQGNDMPKNETKMFMNYMLQKLICKRMSPIKNKFNRVRYFVKIAEDWFALTQSTGMTVAFRNSLNFHQK